jgi:hypothetical protein
VGDGSLTFVSTESPFGGSRRDSYLNHLTKTKKITKFVYCNLMSAKSLDDNCYDLVITIIG